MDKIISMMFATLLMAQSLAYAQGNGVGGGDPCKNEINRHRNAIQKWIIQDEAKDLDFSRAQVKGITYNSYKKSMLNALENGKVVVTCFLDPARKGSEDAQTISVKDGVSYKAITIGNPAQPVTCINYEDREGTPHIDCNYDLVMSKNSIGNPDFKTTHHEFASIAGIEMRTGTYDSDFSISDQLAEFEHPETVMFLGPKNVKSPTVRATNCSNLPSVNCQLACLKGALSVCTNNGDAKLDAHSIGIPDELSGVFPTVDKIEVTPGDLPTENFKTLSFRTDRQLISIENAGFYGEMEANSSGIHFKKVIAKFEPDSKFKFHSHSYQTSSDDASNNLNNVSVTFSNNCTIADITSTAFQFNTPCLVTKSVQRATHLPEANWKGFSFTSSRNLNTYDIGREFKVLSDLAPGVKVDLLDLSGSATIVDAPPIQDYPNILLQMKFDLVNPKLNLPFLGVVNLDSKISLNIAQDFSQLSRTYQLRLTPEITDFKYDHMRATLKPDFKMVFCKMIGPYSTLYCDGKGSSSVRFELDHFKVVDNVENIVFQTDTPTSVMQRNNDGVVVPLFDVPYWSGPFPIKARIGNKLYSMTAIGIGEGYLLKIIVRHVDEDIILSPNDHLSGVHGNMIKKKWINEQGLRLIFNVDPMNGILRLEGLSKP